MGQDIKNKMLEFLYENPRKEFTVREIAKLTRFPRATTHTYINRLKEQGLIDKENIAATNKIFKIKKINYYSEKITTSGLIDYLIEKLNPSCIILFGSIRKGDSTKESDIDLFVESSVKNELDLEGYEKKLGHKIQLFVESNINKLNETLFNNVVNGIKLYGSFKIK